MELRQRIRRAGVRLYAASLYIFTTYNIPQEGMLILTLLLLLDVITGVYKACILWKGESWWFTTKKFTKWVLAKVFLLVIVVALWVVLQYVTWGGMAINVSFNSILWLLIVWEFMSCLQNYLVARTWEPIDEWDVVTYVLRTIHWKIKKRLETKLG